MKLFIVAVPFFNADIAVVAYELRYQSCEKLFGMSQSFGSIDDMLNSPGLDLLDMVGLEPFTGGKPIFIPVNKFLLLTNFYENIVIEPNLITCIVSDDIPIEEVYIERYWNLKERGFNLALKDVKLSEETLPLFQLADYYMVDASTKETLVDAMPIRSKLPDIQFVFIRIASKEAFDSIKFVPASLFEGRFYSQPITKGVTQLSPLKVSAIELLRLSEEVDFDIIEVSKVIAQDPSLSISLLKFINSPAVGVPSKISSINHAVALLGQLETVKWIKVAVSMYMAEDKPNEITKLSLTRARFAENLAAPFGMEQFSSALFLMGIFSILDVVLEMPMDKAMDTIGVDENIREALVNRKGRFGDIINFIYSYEQSDWEKCSYTMVLKEIDVEDINKAYLESLFWYRSILNDLQNATK